MSHLSSVSLAASSLSCCPLPLHALTMPEGFVLGCGPTYPLFTRPTGGKPARRVAPRAFWPIAQVWGGQHTRQLELAFLDDAPTPALRTVRVPFGLLYRPRQLARLLAREGLLLDAGQSPRAAQYLFDAVISNRLPHLSLRHTTGWWDDSKSFQFGVVPLGGRGRLVLPRGPTTAESALVRTGTPAGWKQAATQAIEASPALALVLACSLASPLTRFLATYGPALRLEGPGAGALLGAAASVFGSSELVARPALPARLAERFHSLADLPHLVDTTAMPTLGAARRRQLAAGLESLYVAHRTWAEGPTRVKQREFPGSTLVVLKPGMAERLWDGIARQYVPLRLARTEAHDLRQHEAELARHQGQLGWALCEALTGLPPAERGPLGDEWRRCRTRLDPNHPYAPAVRRWVDTVATAMAAVAVTARLLPELCPDPVRWQAQIEEAWRAVLAAEGMPDPRSRLRLLPGGLDPGGGGAPAPSPPQGKTPGRSP